MNTDGETYYSKHQDGGVWFTRKLSDPAHKIDVWFSGNDARLAAAHYNGKHAGRKVRTCPEC